MEKSFQSIQEALNELQARGFQPTSIEVNPDWADTVLKPLAHNLKVMTQTEIDENGFVNSFTGIPIYENPLIKTFKIHFKDDWIYG